MTEEQEIRLHRITIRVCVWIQVLNFLILTWRFLR
jgi:hypothetical protein